MSWSWLLPNNAMCLISRSSSYSLEKIIIINTVRTVSIGREQTWAIDSKFPIIRYEVVGALYKTGRESILLL
jgi:hypothetical protein